MELCQPRNVATRWLPFYNPSLVPMELDVAWGRTTYEQMHHSFAGPKKNIKLAPLW